LLPISPTVHPTDEVNALQYIVEQNIGPETARGLFQWYGTRAVAAGWQPLTENDIADFRATFSGRLTPQQISTLTEWYVKEVAPRLRGAARS